MKISRVRFVSNVSIQLTIITFSYHADRQSHVTDPAFGIITQWLSRSQTVLNLLFRKGPKSQFQQKQNKKKKTRRMLKKGSQGVILKQRK